MKFVNLTPHRVCFNGIAIEPSGSIARCVETRTEVGMLDGIPIIRKSFGEVTGLPEPKAETIYIVSAIVMQAAKRPDVLCPGDPVRDEDGRIIGCKSLCTL